MPGQAGHDVESKQAMTALVMPDVIGIVMPDVIGIVMPDVIGHLMLTAGQIAGRSRQ